MNMKRVVITDDGTIEFYRGELLHNDNGPAKITLEGCLTWAKDGKIHRDDGPAIIYPSGTQEWYKNGCLCRLDGPAIINWNGTRIWRREGHEYGISLSDKGIKYRDVVKPTIEDWEFYFYPLRNNPETKVIFELWEQFKAQSPQYID